MIQPTGTAIADGRGDEEEGGDAKTPLAWLMGRGNRVQLLQLLGLEDEWERAPQGRSDGEWGRRHGRRALSLRRRGAGWMGGVSVMMIPRTTDAMIGRCRPCSRVGEDVVSALPGPDVLERQAQFWTPSSLGDVIVLCRLLWWCIESNYAGTPYNIVVGADVIAFPYEPVALAWTLHA